MAARQAGDIALGFFGQDPETWYKGKAGMSPVSEADLAVDRFLADYLRSARPDYGWLSEETADDRSRLNHERVFIVDPIDGTRAFLAGGDEWTVAIAVVEAVGLLQLRSFARAGTRCSWPVQAAGPGSMGLDWRCQTAQAFPAQP